MRKNPKLEVKESKHIVKIILICVAGMLSLGILIGALFFPLWPLVPTEVNPGETVRIKLDSSDHTVKVSAFKNPTYDNPSASPDKDKDAAKEIETTELVYCDRLEIDIDGKVFSFLPTDVGALGNGGGRFSSSWHYADLNRDGHLEILLETTDVALLLNSLDTSNKNVSPQSNWHIFTYKNGSLNHVSTIAHGTLKHSILTNKISSTYSGKNSISTGTLYYNLNF